MKSWLATIDPKVVQGLLTLLSAVIGSCVALYIAVKVYPRQREIDRKNEMRKERRAAYLMFASDLLEVQDSFDRIEFGNEARLHEDLRAALHQKVKYERATAMLAMFASPKVMVAVLQGREDLHRLLETLAVETKRILDANPNGIRANELGQQLGNSKLDANDALLRSSEATINAMREEEFTSSGSITFQSRSAGRPIRS